MAVASVGLSLTQQEDFSGGMFRAADRRRIPPNGVYNLVDWMLDDDGEVYRRGGAAYKSNAGFGTTGIRWIWDGLLEPGQRTMFARDNAFGVLAADDATPLNLPLPPETPGTFEVIGWGEMDGVLWIAINKNRPLMYAGSRKTAAYSTGTVSISDGDTKLTGSGSTNFTANVDPGMLLQIGTSKRIYVVDHVVDSHTIELTDDYRDGNETAEPYTLRPIDRASNSNYVTSKNKGDLNALGVVGKRMLIGDGRRVFFSKYGDSGKGWSNDNQQKLPQGTKVTGIAEIRGTGLIFTTRGLWTLENLIADITDPDGNPQHRLELLSGDIVLWGPRGLAHWSGGVLAPSVDGVWWIPAAMASFARAQAPQRISDSIRSLYVGYVRAGYVPGQAEVFRDHLFLPILDASGVVKDVLVCRLDRPFRAGGRTYWPWSRLGGAGGNVAAFVRRVPDPPTNPRLFAGDRSSASRLLDVTTFFYPSGSVKNDQDGSTHEPVIETRDVPTGAGESRNTVRRLRARYSLVDAGADDPTITAEMADEDGVFTALSGAAPEAAEDSPFTWRVEKKVRYARWRLTVNGPAASAVLKSVDTFVRPAGTNR